jgi:FixJ family two-component response regulator
MSSIGFIRKVHAGRKHLPPDVAENLAACVEGDPLTEREVEVLKRIAEGDRNRDIGERVAISEETVDVHVKRNHGQTWSYDVRGFLRHSTNRFGARERLDSAAPVLVSLRAGLDARAQRSAAREERLSTSTCNDLK